MSLRLSTSSAGQIVEAFRGYLISGGGNEFFCQKAFHAVDLVTPGLVLLRDVGEIQLTSVNFHDYIRLKSIKDLSQNPRLAVEFRERLRSYAEAETPQWPSDITRVSVVNAISKGFLQGSARVEEALHRIARQFAASVRDHRLATYRDQIRDFVQIKDAYPSITVAKLVEALEAAGVHNSDYIQGFAMDERGLIFTAELGV